MLAYDIEVLFSSCRENHKLNLSEIPPLFSKDNLDKLGINPPPRQNRPPRLSRMTETRMKAMATISKRRVRGLVPFHSPAISP